MYKAEHIAAAQALRGLSPVEKMALLAKDAHDQAAEAEAKKDHPLKAHRMKKQDWDAHKSHLQDGGGADAHIIGAQLLEALQNDDQESYWDLHPHFIKAALKHIGLITAHPEGGITINANIRLKRMEGPNG